MNAPAPSGTPAAATRFARALDAVGRLGNRLPDPALLFLALLAGIAALVASAWPAGSAWRNANGVLTAANAPLMKSIVLLIFVLFLIPGIVYGYAAGTVRSHGDVIAGMTKATSGMGYYVVMAFFAARSSRPSGSRTWAHCSRSRARTHCGARRCRGRSRSSA